QKARLASAQLDLTEAQEKLRSQLVTRFARTDTRVGASRATLSFLQNQIDAWNAPRN
ncbi:MAG: flagellar hook protein, partial [Novosphingobium sp.]|nr:flagellar hook protein [Novosphingobium sp.]